MLFSSICYCTIYNSLLHAYSIHVYERAGLGHISEAVSTRQYAYVYASIPYSLLDINFNGHQKLIIFSACNSSDTSHSQLLGDVFILSARVITKWCQPLRSYKNTKKKQRGILSILCGRIQFLERFLPTVRKILVRDIREKGGRLKWNSITSSVYGSSRKRVGGLTSTLAWKAGQHRVVEK